MVVTSYVRNKNRHDEIKKQEKANNSPSYCSAAIKNVVGYTLNCIQDRGPILAIEPSNVSYLPGIPFDVVKRNREDLYLPLNLFGMRENHHPETAEHLGTETSLTTIRFTTESVHPRLFLSDDTTNIHAARRQIRRRALTSDHSSIKDQLINNSIERKLNTPSALHFVG